MYKAAVLAVVFLVLGIGVVVFTVKDGSAIPYTPEDAFLPTIQVAGNPVNVQVADMPAEHQRGLSGQEPLPLNQGMLFVFDEDDIYRIWMKDMRFAIDVLWITEDGTIVEVQENIQPESYPEIFGPSVPVRFVLELRAGFVEIYNIQVGDRIET